MLLKYIALSISVQCMCNNFLKRLFRIANSRIHNDVQYVLHFRMMISYTEATAESSELKAKLQFIWWTSKKLNAWDGNNLKEMHIIAICTHFLGVNFVIWFLDPCNFFSNFFSLLSFQNLSHSINALLSKWKMHSFHVFILMLLIRLSDIVVVYYLFAASIAATVIVVVVVIVVAITDALYVYILSLRFIHFHRFGFVFDAKVK